MDSASENVKTSKKNKENAAEKLKRYDRMGYISKGRMDIPFFVLTILLLTIGIIMLLSASFARAYYETGGSTAIFRKQFLVAAGGVVIMLIVSYFSPKLLRKYSKLLMLICVGLLILVVAKGLIGGGARRWINLGFTTFQPSEVAKIGVILYFAAIACRKKERSQDLMRDTLWELLPYLAWLVLIALLLILEPHFSGIIIISIVGLVMMFLGGVKKRYIGAMFVLGGGGGWFLINHVGYTSARLAAWRDPFGAIRDDGWQIVQSLYAVGSGGLLGLGLGQSRQKYLYLPEEHNDYIFSIVCEELGYIGALLILVLFALLIIRGYWIAMNSKDKYSSLIVSGIMTLLSLQVCLNVAVVCNFLPSTGISLPLFSYGGTALLIQLAEMGIVLSVSRGISRK